MMPIYNKLVRDKIPEIIEETGKKYRVKKLDKAEYQKELVLKLSEEINEFSNSTSDEEAVEELTDLLEIIYAIGNLHGVDQAYLESIRLDKAEKRGGFEGRVYLIDVQD
jgi:predicted house-cleaning noncanonical NTP pyrophosphatase (MazG superfamily)